MLVVLKNDTTLSAAISKKLEFIIGNSVTVH